jgi:hypothetical protein
LLDATIVYVLAALDAVGNVLDSRVESFLTDTTLLSFVTGLNDLAVVLELFLEQRRGAADEILVDGESTLDARDPEAHDFVADATIVSAAVVRIENMILHT